MPMPDEGFADTADMKSFRAYAAEVLVKRDRLAPDNMALLVSCMEVVRLGK